MLSPSTLLVALLFVGSLSATTSAETDPFVYYVYYGGSDPCGTDSAVAFHGRVADSNYTIQSARSSSSCAAETACLVDAENEACLAVKGDVVAEASFSYDDEGHIVECDPTNENIGVDYCEVQEKDVCLQSSVYPSCHFRAVPQSELVANPTIVKNNEVGDQVDDQITVIHYSDSNCENVAAINQHLVGNATVTVPEDSDVTCDEAMACALNPSSPPCKSLGLTKEIEIRHEINTEGNVVACVDECVTPSVDCNQTPIYPSCYVRVVRSKEFFSDPASFLDPGTTSTTSVSNWDWIESLL